MNEILFQYYRINPTTWVYIASLMMIALYFKFSRFWSVRNLDLVLLILLAPGLLIAQYGGETQVKAQRLEVLEQKEKAKAGDTAPAEPGDSPQLGEDDNASAEDGASSESQPLEGAEVPADWTEPTDQRPADPMDVDSDQVEALPEAMPPSVDPGAFDPPHKHIFR